MAKFFELSEENQALIDDRFQVTGMHNYINLLVFGVSKAREVIKVSKANPLAEKVGNCPDSVVCIVYEEAFDRLDDEMRKMLVDDAFANVAYDSEKDKIIVGAPQITVTVSGRKTFGDALINAAESAVYAIQQIEEEKRLAKEAEREAKKKKNN